MISEQNLERSDATKFNSNSKAGYMKKKYFVIIASIISVNGFSQTSLQKIEPVNFADVNITDEFWKPKIDKVATKTLSACIYQTEVATPRIKNFERVARKKGEPHEGIFMMTVMYSRRWKRWLIH